MNKFLFIDGPDGVGKSTLCENLEFELPLVERSKRVVQLPSAVGPLGFIRSLVKNPEFKCYSEFRQALHVMNHIVTFHKYEESDGLTIFDRGPASSYVYGFLSGMRKEEINILMEVQLKVLTSLPVNLQFIVLTHDRPFGHKGASDGSYYENLDLSNINELYKKFSEYLSENYFYKVDFINVTDLSPSQVTSSVLSLLF